MYIRDIAVGADEALVEKYPGGFVYKFGRDALCVEHLFLRFFSGRLSTPNTVKVNIVASDATERPVKEDVEWMLDVVSLPWPFPFEEYTHESDLQCKKHLIANLIRESLLWLADQQGWDQSPILSAIEKCIEVELANRGIWPKSQWKSRDGKCKAMIHFDFDLESIELSVVLFDRRGREIGRKWLATEVPLASGIPSLIGEGRWLSKYIFRLKSKSTYWKKESICDLSEILKTRN
jgi:hypothetical protein